MKLIKSFSTQHLSKRTEQWGGEVVSKDGANVDVANVWNRRRQWLFSHASNTTFPFQRNNAVLPRTVNDHGVKPENSAPPICLPGGLFLKAVNPPPPAYLCQHEVVDKRVFSCVEGRTKRFCPREVIPGQGRRWLPLPFIVQSGHRPVVVSASVLGHSLSALHASVICLHCPSLAALLPKKVGKAT